MPGLDSKILLERTLGDDARSAIGKDRGYYHLVTIGIVISKAPHKHAEFLVVNCLDQAERTTPTDGGDFGLGWSKSHSFFTGQTRVLRYNRQLLQDLHDRIPIADVVNGQVISLEEAPKGYADFDKGAPMKFVLDPHGIVAKAA